MTTITTTTPESTEDLPRWDLDSIFPGPQSPEFREALANAARANTDLEALFDRHGVGGPPTPARAVDITAVEEVINRYNAVLDAAMRIEGYLYCLVAADVRDEKAQSAAGEWRQIRSQLARLNPRFIAWAGALDSADLAMRSQVVRAHLPTLRRLRLAAAHLMPPGEEDLAAALGPSGAAAWMALRDELAGRATARIAIDGEERELPLSEIANLAYNPDRDLRRRAYEAETAAWRGLSVPLAAALNGVKSQQLTLAQRRGWGDPLDQALYANAIDRATLDAMQTAIHDALPDYQRYLRAKARLLGLPVLAGYDLRAPVGEPPPWPFATAQAFILETFASVHPRLGALAERAFAERWIDAEPRPGKDGGAFSFPVGGEQTRIFANYLPVYDWMSALAHELGHSYHVNAIAARGRTMLQAPAEMAGVPFTFPMTLGETASTICEALVQQAARQDALPAQEVALLDGWLQALTLNVFQTLPMFIVEREVFAARRRRELAATEIDALMASAWRDMAGDAIDPDTVPVTDWTAPHLFIDGLWYYNFPYAFGMLFGLGLLAARDAHPAAFFDRFDDLLADSGMYEAADLAARFGIDLRDPTFWRSGLDLFRADVDRLESLARERLVSL
jgi:oligoendopeptidase F